VHQLVDPVGELVLALYGGVGAAGSGGDAGELLPDLVVQGEAEGVDDQMGALGGQFAGDLAGVGRGAVVLAVGDEDDPPGGLAGAQVLGGGAQREPDRGPAGGARRVAMAVLASTLSTGPTGVSCWVSLQPTVLSLPG
jgi:hypothetical protein